jgi:hypothetical protein
MATEAQIAANRRNAALSTGPKTLEGKEISSQNPLRHGLRARTAAALDETDEDFTDHHLKLMLALLPRDTYEFVLVRRLAQLSWRLERLAGMEAAMLDGVASRIAAIQARYADPDDPPSFETGRPSDDLWNADMPLIARYESTLERAFNRAMASLDRYRATRRLARKDSSAAARDAAPAERPPRHDFLPNEPNSADADTAENSMPERAWEPPKNPDHAYYRKNEANLAEA